MQIITLSNGKRVGNFSSPHEFKFTDGSVLPAVSNEEAERLKVTFIEEVDKSNGDVSLEFELSDEVIAEMRKWRFEDVDVVLCPMPMIIAIKEDWAYGKGYLKASPFRGVRIEDRIQKLVSIDKQCI